MVSMRSEKPICAPPRLSEVSPNAAFETIPVFVWGSRSRSRARCARFSWRWRDLALLDSLRLQKNRCSQSVTDISRDHTTRGVSVTASQSLVDWTLIKRLFDTTTQCTPHTPTPTPTPIPTPTRTPTPPTTPPLCAVLPGFFPLQLSLQ